MQAEVVGVKKQINQNGKDQELILNIVINKDKKKGQNSRN